MCNETSRKSRFHIGMRNIKTGLAVFFCLLIYQLIGRDGYFLAATSAIICMQDSVEKSVVSGLSRMVGTAFGAVLGMVLLYVDILLGVDLTLLWATLGTVLMILFCNIIRQPDSIVIGCVVLLMIVLQQTGQEPFFYSVDRLFDTFVGIFLAVLVNRYVRNPARSKPENQPAETQQPTPPQTQASANNTNPTHKHKNDEEGAV